MSAASALKAKLSRITLATASDLPAIKRTMERANDYALKLNGEAQWTLLSFVYGQLRNHVDVDEGFVIKAADGEVEMFVVLSQEDPYMWGDEGMSGTALYIHKFMKDPTIARPGDGLLMLAFAAEQALRRSKQVLRCDVKASMEGLIAYYERLGFQKQRETIYQSTGQVAYLLQADPEQVLQRTTAKFA